MINNWYMLTLIGKDRPGIVAKISSALYMAGCNLGETSMIRLGGNFTTMIMVQYEGTRESLIQKLEPEAKAMSLFIHLDKIEGHLHDHRIPDACITVYGADKAGIVAKVTTKLAEAGLDILDLKSDVGGSKDKPMYIMQIEGYAGKGFDELDRAVNDLTNDEVEVHLEPIDTIIG